MLDIERVAMLFILFAIFVAVGLFALYFAIDEDVEDDLEDMDYGC
jgi:hypothetical protein